MHLLPLPVLWCTAWSLETAVRGFTLQKIFWFFWLNLSFPLSFSPQCQTQKVFNMRPLEGAPAQEKELIFICCGGMPLSWEASAFTKSQCHDVKLFTDWRKL